MSGGIFKSPEARARLEGWYQRFLAGVGAQVVHRRVETALGESHVLELGDPTRTPLLALHGALASSAHLAVEMAPLLERFHVFAPDLPGQSVRGPEVRLALDGDAYARWLVQVLDGLGIASIDVLGVSFGGFVALQTMAVAAARIERAVLLVPAGVVSGSVWRGLTRAALPMALYKWSPNQARLRRFLDAQLTVWDDEWGAYLGDALLDVALDLRAPPLFQPAALRGFTRPVLALAASDDLSFPGPALLERIPQLLPQAELSLIENCRHVPPTNATFRAWLADRVTAFLRER